MKTQLVHMLVCGMVASVVFVVMDECLEFMEKIWTVLSRRAPVVGANRTGRDLSKTELVAGARS